jgi:hypothetical protein
MKQAVRLIASFVIVASLGVGVTAVFSSPARAVENPCDPTYQMLRGCKAQHGHFDVSCCCCRLH